MRSVYRPAIVLSLLTVTLIWVLYVPSSRKKQKAKDLHTCYFLPPLQRAISFMQEVQSLADHWPYPLQDQVMEGFFALNQCEFKTHGSCPQKQKAFKKLAIEFAFTNGPYAYVFTGYSLAQLFFRTLKVVLKRAEDSDISVSEYVMLHRGDPVVRDLINTSGDFIIHAEKNGLLRDHLCKNGRFYVSICLFLYRWMGFLDLKDIDIIQFIPIDCITAGLGYFVERGKSMPIYKRYELLRRIEVLDHNYPAGKVRLLLMLVNGDFKGAYSYWKIAPAQ